MSKKNLERLEEAFRKYQKACPSFTGRSEDEAKGIFMAGMATGILMAAEDGLMETLEDVLAWVAAQVAKEALNN